MFFASVSNRAVMARGMAILLGSTALTPSATLAQSITPAGGGTVTTTSGAISGGQAGQGIEVDQTGAGGVTATGVSISNTTGSPSQDGLGVYGLGGVGVGLSFQGNNNIIASSGGTAAVLTGGSGENIGYGVAQGGSANLTGLNGLVLAGDQNVFLADPTSGTTNVSAQTQGTGTGIKINAGLNVGGSLGGVLSNGFATGIDVNAGSINLGIQTGSIAAGTAGINLRATNGITLTSGAAIVASDGIRFSSATGGSVTTLVGATINSTAAGSGNGIAGVSTTSGNVAVVSGAAIGGTTAPRVGIGAIATGTGNTGVVDVDVNAQVNATGVGVFTQQQSQANRGTIDINANITAATGTYNFLGTVDVNVAAGVTVTGTGAPNSSTSLTIDGTSYIALTGYGIYDVNGSGKVTNSGTITATGTGVYTGNPGQAVINNASGVISGTTGVYSQNAGTISNLGLISGTTVGIGGNTGNLTNSGQVTGGTTGINQYGGNTTNTATGVITGGANAILTSGPTSIVNAGLIQVTGGQSGTGSAAIYTNNTGGGASQIQNSGTIIGGSNATHGYGIDINDGPVTITNLSGGLVGGGLGSIRLASNDAATVNLAAGSTTSGNIDSSNIGTRTITVAGLLNGSYTNTGTGNTTFTLSGGQVTGNIAMGTGNDQFVYNGGTFGGTINAGAGTDLFTSALGTGNSASLNLADILGFESLAHQSGTLTLSGSAGFQNAIAVTAGASLNVAGTINSANTYAVSVNGNTPGSVVNVLSGAAITGLQGVWFNGATSGTLVNAGSINVTYGPGVSTNGSTQINNSGTIVSSGQYGAVTTGFSVATLNNSGLVNSTQASVYGVTTSFSGMNINNQNGGTISGGLGGITAGTTGNGGLLNIVNQSGAAITGTTAINTQGLASLSLNNSGNIVATTTGINALGTAGTTIINSGTIGTGTLTAGTYAASGLGTGINGVNATVINSGQINANAGIVATGSLSLNNSGSITGQNGNAITAGSANIVNAGSIAALGSGSTAAISISGNGSLTNGIGGSIANASGTALALNGGGNVTNYGQMGNINSSGNAAATINLLAGSNTGNITLGTASDVVAIYNGRGTTGAATVDSTSGNVLQNAGTVNGAVYGNINLGGGLNSLYLRGTGDGTAANGASGTFNLAQLTGATSLIKSDAGTWTLTGAVSNPAMNINAGVGGTPGSGGLLIFNGVTGLTGYINVNGGTIRAMNAGAFGTGTIYALDPTIQFGASGTYANTINLQSANRTTDPTVLQTFGTGISVTLSGQITEGTAAQPLVFSSVDANGNQNAGTFQLTNTANHWTGSTTINTGVTLAGTSQTISGNSIIDNGVLAYDQSSLVNGLVSQNISGNGQVTVSGALSTVTFGGNNAQLRGFRTLDGSSIAFTGSNLTGNYATVSLAAGSRLGVRSGATLHSTNNNAVVVNGNNPIIDNAGTIISDNYAAIYGSNAFTGTTVYNSGQIQGSTTVGYTPAISLNGGNSTVYNFATGDITGARGVYVQGGNSSVGNEGTITGTVDNAITLVGGGTVTNYDTGVLNATGTSGAWGILATDAPGQAVNVNNYGVINASSGIVTQTSYGPASVLNQGTIVSSEDAVWTLAGTINFDNYGSITSTGGTGVASQAGGNFTNSGEINAATYGIFVSGPSNIVNFGTISATVGSLLLDGPGDINVDLQANSTTTGNAISTGSGYRNIAVSGLLDGIYDASNSQGVQLVTLGRRGQIGGAVLGTADDTFITNGGVTSGLIDGGAGANLFLANIAAGDNGAISLSNITNFQTLQKVGAGDVTLVGAPVSSPTTIVAGDGTPSGTLAFAGTNALTSNIIVNGANIQAQSEGAFGSGAITANNGAIQFGASGTFTNSIVLAATGTPISLQTLGGAQANLTGAITQAPLASAQDLNVGSNGTLILSNTGNSWNGFTTIELNATLQGASNTISGSSIVVNGALNYVQPGSGAVTQNISGSGRVNVSGLSAGELTFAGNLTNNGINVLDSSSITLRGVNNTSGTGVALLGAGGIVNVDSGASLTTASTAINTNAMNVQVNNAGTISGTGANGYGVVFGPNSSGQLVNQTGGTISGDQAAIVAATDNDLNIDLQHGSTVNRGIVSIAAGTRSLQIDGALNGGYNALAGTGSNNVVLGATGTVDNIALGAGNDSVTLKGSGLTGVIDGGAGNDTLTFNIAGNATFDAGHFGNFELRSSNGPGVLTLTGTDALTADFQLNAGTLVLNGDAALNNQAGLVTAAGTTTRLEGGNQQVRSIAGAGSIDLGSNALIVAGQDNATYSGQISGTGSLALFGGTLTLAGINSYTGQTQVSTGTLRLGTNNALAATSGLFVGPNGTFNLAGYNQTVGSLGGSGVISLGAGRLTVNQTTDNLFGGSINGTGGLTINGAYVFNLTGANTYTGDTIVDAGTLNLDGSITSAVVLNNGARLTGNGSIGSLNVGNGAIIAPGNENLGRLNVTGNLNFAAGSTYQVTATPQGADNINATGNVNIAGGTVQVLANGTDFSPLSRYAIINAIAVSGTFNSVASNLAFLAPSLEYGANSVNLVLRRNDVGFDSVAKSANQAAVAGAVASLRPNELFDRVLVQSAEGAQTAFDALSGELYATTSTALLAQGDDLQNSMASNSPRANGVGAWIDAGRGWSNLDGSVAQGTAPASLDSDHYIGGLNFKHGKFSATASAGKVKSTLDVSGRGSSAKIHSTLVGGQVQSGGDHDLYAVVGGNVGHYKIRSSRTIVFPGLAEGASSNRDGHGFHLFGEVGYTAAIGGVNVTPFAGISHDSLTLDAVSETPGLAALEVAAQKSKLTNTNLGIKLSSSFNLGKIAVTPRGSLSWQRSCGDLTGQASAVFQAGGTGYSLAGSALSRNAAKVGFGIGLDLGKASLGAGYDGTLGGFSDEHTAKVTLQIRF